MENFDTKSVAFLAALNERINPVLVATVYDPKQGIFKVSMAETTYADSGAGVNVSKKFMDTVVELGRAFFNDETTFNNTANMWWF